MMSEAQMEYDPISESDPVPVIKSQLVENTGKHLLDSGDAYGRHWEENQRKPPWEKPEYVVSDEYVVHNVFHYMADNLERDHTSVVLERALYQLSYSDEYLRSPWRTCIDEFEGRMAHHELDFWEDSLDPDDMAILSMEASEFESEGQVSWNTYNQENHTLTQCLQGYSLGGFYGEYAIIQVHNGTDVRGGYTKPRVYSKGYNEVVYPMEFSYNVDEIGWYEAESCLWDEPDLLYQNEIDRAELAEFWNNYQDPGHDQFDQKEVIEMVEYVAQNAESADYMQGGVFLRHEGGLYNVSVF